MRSDRKPGQDYTAREAADELRIGYTTLTELCKAGKIKAYRHGIGRGVWRISEAALAEYREGAASTRSDDDEGEIKLKHIKVRRPQPSPPRHASPAR